MLPQAELGVLVHTAVVAADDRQPGVAAVVVWVEPKEVVIAECLDLVMDLLVEAENAVAECLELVTDLLLETEGVDHQEVTEGVGHRR